MKNLIFFQLCVRILDIYRQSFLNDIFFLQIEMSNKAAPEYLQIDLLNLTEVTAIATQVIIKKINRFRPLEKLTNAVRNPLDGLIKLGPIEKKKIHDQCLSHLNTHVRLLLAASLLQSLRDTFIRSPKGSLTLNEKACKKKNIISTGHGSSIYYHYFDSLKANHNV